MFTNFSKHKDVYNKFVKPLEKPNYAVKVTTDKSFVGIEITRDSDFNYYMSQANFKQQICHFFLNYPILV